MLFKTNKQTKNKIEVTLLLIISTVRWEIFEEETLHLYQWIHFGNYQYKTLKIVAAWNKIKKKWFFFLQIWIFDNAGVAWEILPCNFLKISFSRRLCSEEYYEVIKYSQLFAFTSTPSSWPLLNFVYVCRLLLSHGIYNERPHSQGLFSSRGNEAERTLFERALTNKEQNYWTLIGWNWGACLVINFR